MRVAVDGGGFVAAGAAARTANQVAALHYDSLSGKLSGFGAMAGNDATSMDFSRSYDAASAEALDALADLSAAFIGLGRLLRATDANHERAEATSAGLTVSAYSGLDLHEDDYVRVARSSPPSSLGAQEPGFGEVETWILDRIEGFVWPGADVGSLRDAASTWRNAATGVDDLVDYCERASVEVGRQISPEIPLALDAIDDLRGSVRSLRDEFAELARMCDEYAAGVEAAHERTRALLAEVAQMIVEGMVISAAVGLITGGTASGVVASATVARVLEQAPRFQALLIALRDAASVCASRLRTAREGAVAVRARLEKFLRVDVRGRRARAALDERLAKIAKTVGNPKMFDPTVLRGLDAEHVRRLVAGWKQVPARNGDGVVFIDTANRGRQIRVMEGYPGNRPDPMTHGPYAVVSQNGQPPVKIPLKGNPTL